MAAAAEKGYAGKESLRQAGDNSRQHKQVNGVWDVHTHSSWRHCVER